MAIPQAVVAQRERANNLINQLNTPGDAPAAQPPINEPRVQDDPPAPQSPAAAPAVQPDADHDWKKRYEGLRQSRENSAALLSEQKQETSRLATENANLLERIENLEQMLANQPTAPVAADRTYLSDDDINTFGEHNLPVVEKVAQQTANRILADDRKQRELQDQKRNAEMQRDRAAREMKNDFHQRLRGAVTDFDRVDSDPAFEAFMQEVDPISGAKRSDLLARAFSVNDVGRAASFYNEFVASTARDPREHLVQPQPAGSADPAPAAQSDRTYRQSDIALFYKDVSLGKYASNPQEKERIEADIFAAQRSGRVRPG